MAKQQRALQAGISNAGSRFRGWLPRCLPKVVFALSISSVLTACTGDRVLSKFTKFEACTDPAYKNRECRIVPVLVAENELRMPDGNNCAYNFVQRMLLSHNEAVNSQREGDKVLQSRGISIDLYCSPDNIAYCVSMGARHEAYLVTAGRSQLIVSLIVELEE